MLVEAEPLRLLGLVIFDGLFLTISDKLPILNNV
jgi:hypothetical protein